MTGTRPPSLLSVAELSVRFRTSRGVVTAVDRLSFDLAAGETLALVGESGCGKSVTALALLRLLASPPAEIEARHLSFDGTDLLALPEAGMRRLRGGKIAIVFQDPLSALNPVRSIGDQILETLHLHTDLRGAAAKRRAIELLDLVQIPEPQRRFEDYPHRLSGGMRQRVLIAAALAGAPKLLIADEPTTALDVTIQAQILRLLAELRRDLGMALLLITHDLGVVAETADRVLVMYAGRKAEERSVDGLFGQPGHPYSRGLMAARPVPGQGLARLTEIPGTVPPPGSQGPGCAFAPRCPVALPQCATLQPAPTLLADGSAACWQLAPPVASAAPPSRPVIIDRMAVPA